ncbi:disease resistance protein [Striga asiatica]|uniref:Disease resistance protein n=1 Tax=Striga asiatica TaxID=4170 RepID=A0A5A7R0A8_STRAF|nr:disease resistance protein [Striga asiatica]
MGFNNLLVANDDLLVEILWRIVAEPNTLMSILQRAKNFLPIDAEAIIRIPLDHCQSEDQLFWHLENNANSSSKQKYMRHQIKNNLKHFIWMCVNNVISSTVNLQKKRIFEDARYSMCGEVYETLEQGVFCKRLKERFPVRFPLY